MGSRTELRHNPNLSKKGKLPMSENLFDLIKYVCFGVCRTCTMSSLNSINAHGALCSRHLLVVGWFGGSLVMEGN